MKKIIKALIKNGYEIWEQFFDNKLEGINRYIRFRITKEDNRYRIENAILCYFDRWANSGKTFFVNSENEVISYFSNPSKYITDAVSELVYDIVDEATEGGGDFSKIEKMIEFLDTLNSED